MHVELAHGSEVTVVDLVDGTVRVGGDADDEIHFAGLPPRVLSLTIAGHRLTATASVPLRIGQSRAPAHVARLMAPGEVLTLPNGVRLRALPGPMRAREQNATAMVLRDLVRGAAPELSAPTLTCLTGKSQGRSWALGGAETLVGRADGCLVQLDDGAVSRRHLRVLQVKGRFFAAPCPDTNGVFVNGGRLARSTPLQPGDVLELGHTLLRFDAPPPPPPDRSEETVLVRPAPPPVEVSVVPVPESAPPDETTGEIDVRTVTLERVAWVVAAFCLAMGLGLLLLS